MRTVYLNGAFVPESEAKLSIYDLSVMQAAAAFEMTRSFHCTTFRLVDHLERLQRSCDLLSIPFPLTITELVGLCHDVQHQNDPAPGEEHRLLIVVSPGCAPMYRELEGVIPHPFVYIADFPLSLTTKGFSKYFMEGVHCVTSAIQQVPDACIPSTAKHRSRLHFHLAQQQAPAGTWPILKDFYGMYTEAPGANLCWVHRGKVVVMEEDCLPGISMQTVKELTGAEASNLYAPILPEHIDELWLTGTPFCMLPVVSLDGKPIGDGTIGPVYKETLKKWNDLVGLDIAQQIIAWDEEKPSFLNTKLWTPTQQRTMDAQRTRTT